MFSYYIIFVIGSLTLIIYVILTPTKR